MQYKEIAESRLLRELSFVAFDVKCNWFNYWNIFSTEEMICIELIFRFEFWLIIMAPYEEKANGLFIRVSIIFVSLL